MTTQPKDYLGTENARNKQHAALYVAIIQAAFGPQNDCLIGHHLTFEAHGDIDSENEIPSADTMIFDHTIMGAVFGPGAPYLMAHLAMLPVDTGARDAALKEAFERRMTAVPAHGFDPDSPQFR